MIPPRGEIYVTVREALAAGAGVHGGRPDDLIRAFIAAGTPDISHSVGECLWTGLGASNQPKAATG